MVAGVPGETPAQAGHGTSLGRIVRLLPALVTVGMAVLTLVGVAATALQARRDATARGAALSADMRAQTIATVDATIKRTEDLALGLGASWSTRTAIFGAVAHGLLASPVINGVGLIERIAARRLSDFERLHGPIEARTAAGVSHRAPPARSYLLVGSSIEANQGASGVGLDIGADPSRHATLLAAGASGQPRATPPVRLMSSDRAGTVLYTPIYGRSPHAPRTPAQRAQALLGFVSTGYRYDLLLRALQRTIPPGTHFSLSDAGTRLLAQGTPRRPIRTRIAVAGRSWTLAVQTPSTDLLLPITILLAGGLLTVLVGTLVVQAKRRERYAQELVARRLREREVAERALAQAEERFRTSFAEAPIGMALTSLEGRFLQVNRALAEITGYDEEQLLALAFASELTHPDDRRGDRRGAVRMRSGQTRIYDAENRYLHAAGHIVWVAIHTTLIRDEHGAPAYFLSQIEDISARRRSELRLRHMADHDSLTGLLNRRAYERRLEDHLRRGERYGHDGAVLVIDLDDFKEVNDTLGHRAGDELIVRVAGALATRLRESDTLARLGGDEFAILTPTGGAAEAERLAESLLETVRHERAARGPGGRARPVTASIGIAPLAQSGRPERRGGPDQRRSRDVRRQGGRSRPQRDLRRPGPRAGSHRGPPGVGRAHPRRARREPARAARPARRRDRDRAHHPARAAGAHGRRPRRPDPTGELPPDRRAFRADPRDRPLGRDASDRDARRAPRRGSAADGRDQHLGPLAGRSRARRVHRAGAAPPPRSTPDS